MSAASVSTRHSGDQLKCSVATKLRCLDVNSQSWSVYSLVEVKLRCLDVHSQSWSVYSLVE
ncbi:hypothetical protein P3L10_014317 [Capsicum annuum]